MVAPAVLRRTPREEEFPFTKLMRDFGIRIPKGSEQTAELYLHSTVIKYGGRSRLHGGERLFGVDSTWRALCEASSAGTLSTDLLSHPRLPQPGNRAENNSGYKPPPTGLVEQLTARAEELGLLTSRMAAERLKVEFPEPSRQFMLDRPNALLAKLAASYGLRHSHQMKIGKMSYKLFAWQDVRHAYVRMAARKSAKSEDQIDQV